MDFLALQNEVLSDRFDEAKRGAVKNWINYRYGRLWDMEDWAFKTETVAITLPEGANSVAVPTSLTSIEAIWDGTIFPSSSVLDGIRPEAYLDNASSTSGSPLTYTIIAGTIYFDRLADRNRTLTAVGQMAFTPLTGDSQEPAIPSEFHEALAMGAASHGLRLEADPSWQGFEQDWQQAIQEMRKQYLSSVKTPQAAFPAWP